jgi:ABC-2 type transport system ATP-binding protein
MTVLLTADNIRVEFGALVAVRDVSFELSGGQLVGLVGPNGAGKTTLLRVLSGLHAPTRGAAYVMDEPVLGGRGTVRHHIGFAPETPPAYEELTIDQFLRFIAAAYDLAAHEAEERMGFWLERLWLVEKQDAQVRHLSRGMRQRLTLARTFLPQPHVLLLDEPLAGLDPAGRIELRGVLGMLRDQGCAMIVSSHILADLEEVATHIAIIEHGSILRFTETDTLRHDRAERRTYRVTTVDDRPDHGRVIAAIEGVSDVTHEDRTYTFEYHSGEREAAGLLRQLVTEDVPVVSFAVVTRSLEEVYLKSGVKQVD